MPGKDEACSHIVEMLFDVYALCMHSSPSLPDGTLIFL